MTEAGVFDRIVCGVDGTPESLEAVRHALALAPSGARIHLFCAVNLAPALVHGWSAPQLADELAREAGDALDEAAALAPQATRRLVSGRPVGSLFAEIEREKATLVAVGTHGTSRPEGIILGGTTTTLLHEAPRSVLVARKGDDASFDAIAVGVDGSPESELAAEVALELADRLGARLRGIVALGGKGADVDLARRVLPDVEIDRRRPPVEALVEVSRGASLLVVGSRGLHGVRALGSVSERVGHRAVSSVLVVRRHP